MIPFNIDLLILKAEDIDLMRPVKTSDIFLPSSRNFNPDGLFSTEIFGRVSEERRMRTFSYIDLKVEIIHPVIYYAITSLQGFYQDLIKGREHAVWDDKLKNFVRSDPVNGQTGYSFFFNHFKDIKHVRNNSKSRNFTIDLVEKYKNDCTFSKLLVMPAGLRDYTIEDEGKPSYDEINDLYKKLISASGIINLTLYKLEPESMDTIRNNIQQNVLEVYNYLRGLVEGKTKFVQSKWLSRKTYNGTRNVISTIPMDIQNLGTDETISYNQTAVSLFQYIKGALPIVIHDLRSGILGKIIRSSNEPATLVNMKTLKSEEVVLDSDEYDRYLTDQGLEDIISKFGIEELRNDPVIINNHYLALIYNDGKNVKVIKDIDELPSDKNKEFVSPITFAEWIYISVYKNSLEVPALLTRYPVSTLGSTYPSYVYLKTTNKYLKVNLLSDDWETIEETLPQFPDRNSNYFNTFSPHPTRLARLGADFDGDQLDLVILYTEESKKEIKDLLNSKRFYVNQNNQITNTGNYDTVSYVIASMTGD